MSHLPPLEKQAEDMTLQRWEELGHTHHAMWADNMFYRHFLTNPMRSNVSADVSVIMVVPTRRRLPVFTGHKHIADVRTSVSSTTILVQESVTNLLQGIHFTLRNIKQELLRIPLGFVGPVVKPLCWKPLAVSESRSGTHAELFRLLTDMRKIQRRTGHNMPLLIDMKIYRYIIRFLYGRDYHTCNVRFWLKDVPLLYGAWHPYK